MSIIWKRTIVTPKPVTAPRNPIVQEKNFLPTNVTKIPNIMSKGDKIYGLCTKNSVKARAEKTGQPFLWETVTFGEHSSVVESTLTILTSSSAFPILLH